LDFLTFCFAVTVVLSGNSTIAVVVRLRCFVPTTILLRGPLVHGRVASAPLSELEGATTAGRSHGDAL
jgi:hypothetical protein